VLQQVAALFVQTLDHHRAVGDGDQLAAETGHRRRDLSRVRWRPSPGAALDLRGWADVAQLTDAEMAVVVRHAMRVGHCAARLAEQW
jgi:hypothetical protein